MIVLHLIVICLLLTNIRSIQLYPMPCISYSKILCLVHLRYSLFPANTILKMLLVTQFAYFASLQKPPFEEFSCVLLFQLRLWRLLLVADNQCTEGSQVPWGRLTMFHTPLMYTRLCSVFLQTKQYTYKYVICSILLYSSLST